jgi:hypothetical protein
VRAYNGDDDCLKLYPKLSQTSGISIGVGIGCIEQVEPQKKLLHARLRWGRLRTEPNLLSKMLHNIGSGVIIHSP